MQDHLKIAKNERLYKKMANFNTILYNSSYKITKTSQFIYILLEKGECV
jgi:hypothetical protein